MAEESSIDYVAREKEPIHPHFENPGEPAEANNDRLTSIQQEENRDTSVHDDGNSTQKFDEQTPKMMTSYNKKGRSEEKHHLQNQQK